MIRGRPPKYALDWRQAEEVRRLRRAGASWRLVAERMGWRTHNPQAAVEGALRRAPKPPEAVALAEADPALSRRCAVCGRPNYSIRKLGDGSFVTNAVGFVRRGGRWLCPDCAPKRRGPTRWQSLWGDPPEVYGTAK